MKKVLKVFSVVFVITVLSLMAFAAPGAVTITDTAMESLSIPESDTAAKTMKLQGDGTEESPYIISTAAQFNTYANYVNNNNSTYGEKYYKLSGNIDFRGVNMVPFGVSLSAPFKGTLDGNGYSLLNVNVPDKAYCGVVGYMTKGTIKNLGVSYVQMTEAKSFSNLKYFGGILGYARLASSGTINISGCEVDGVLMLDLAGAAYVGGVVGYMRCENGDAYINDCVSHASIDVTSAKNGYVGGFASYLIAGSTRDYRVKNCVCDGDISYTSTYVNATVAGFAAYINKDQSGWSGWADEDASLLADSYNFENCISTGNVSGKATTNVYAGGFVGYKDGEGEVTLSNSYKNSSADIEVDSEETELCSLGTEAAEEDLLSKDFYSAMGYDFSNKWYMTDYELRSRNVAKTNGSAVTNSGKSLRLDANPGIRFHSEIEMYKRDYVMEYGVIVARCDLLGSDELTLDYTGKKAVGIGYNSTTDKFLEKDDEQVVFTAVVHSIPEEYYDVEFVIRTYVKYVCDGETVVLYGNTQTSSINLSAQAIRDSETYEILTDEQKQLLETMLPTA